MVGWFLFYSTAISYHFYSTKDLNLIIYTIENTMEVPGTQGVNGLQVSVNSCVAKSI